MIRSKNVPGNSTVIEQSGRTDSRRIFEESGALGNAYYGVCSANDCNDKRLMMWFQTPRLENTDQRFVRWPKLTLLLYEHHRQSLVTYNRAMIWYDMI